MKQERYDCLIGFDGYVDELYSAVKNRQDSGHYSRYETIEGFGKRIMDAAHKSADIEIAPIKTAVGGNAPIMANAMAALGLRVVCAGLMDCGQDDDPFRQMHVNCERISIGPVNRTTALEFSDGKIMLGNLRGSSVGWKELKERAGIQHLRELVSDCRLIGVVNWSGMFHMNEILEGLWEEILSGLDAEENDGKTLFLDLADPTARTEQDLQRLYGLIQKISKKISITLGMNENEAIKVGESLGIRDCGIQELGEELRDRLGIFRTVIHTNRNVYGFQEGQCRQIQNILVKNPVSTTGAGDHFNAGFCMGMLKDRTMEECMVLGQATSSFYIRRGYAPDEAQLYEYIEKYYGKEAVENEQ